jgi:type I restriction enzyme, S subunit
VNIQEAFISMKNGTYRSSDVYSSDGIACLRMYNIESGKIKWFDVKRMNLHPEEVEEAVQYY